MISNELLTLRSSYNQYLFGVGIHQTYHELFTKNNCFELVFTKFITTSYNQYLFWVGIHQTSHELLTINILAGLLVANLIKLFRRNLKPL